MIEGVGALATGIGKLLELFKQKAYVYVEVSFNHVPPFCLKVVNNSSFEIEIESLEVTPDGFPSDGNGWHLNDSSVFQNKILKPGQKIKFYLDRENIGEAKKREFRVKYHTLVAGKKVPRKEQSCVHVFEHETNRVSVVATFGGHSG